MFNRGPWLVSIGYLRLMLTILGLGSRLQAWPTRRWGKSPSSRSFYRTVVIAAGDRRPSALETTVVVHLCPSTWGMCYVNRWVYLVKHLGHVIHFTDVNTMIHESYLVDHLWILGMVSFQCVFGFLQRGTRIWPPHMPCYLFIAPWSSWRTFTTEVFDSFGRCDWGSAGIPLNVSNGCVHTGENDDCKYRMMSWVKVINDG